VTTRGQSDDESEDVDVAWLGGTEWEYQDRDSRTG
jgi:hypothetical protein